MGSYATHPDLSPKSMRSWLYVYVVFCFVSAFSAASLCVVHAIFGNLNILPEWQHGILSLLGAGKFYTILILGSAMIIVVRQNNDIKHASSNKTKKALTKHRD